MTYLFKLARRMAFARRAGVLALVTLGCSEAAPREFLSPDPGTHPSQPAGAVTLVVSSAVSDLPYDQIVPFVAWGREADGDSVAVAVSWSASAGVITSDGAYRGTIPGTHTVSAFAVGKPSLTGSAPISVSQPGPLFRSLTISPKPVIIGGGAHVVFAATARLQSGANTLPSVTWAATGGAISPSGEFAAPLEPGEYQVVATSLDGLVTDTARVLVEPPSLIGIQVEPQVVTIASGETQDFLVAANWSDGTTEIPELVWLAEGGSIMPASGGAAGGPQAAGGDRTWRFVAGLTPGNYKVVVRDSRRGRTDTASVTVTPVLARIELTPAAADLLPGATRSFKAAGWMTDGSPSSVNVSWSATGGTITGGGVYSAGTTPGTFRVVARTTSGTLADTAVVRIAQPSATLTRLTLSPDAGTAPVNDQVAFQVEALWSDGSTGLPLLTWTAQAGTVSSQGVWTTPASAGTYRVIVKHAGGSAADTAQMSVVVPPPSLSGLAVSPKTPAVQGGQQVTFAASATWTNGSNTVPPLQWTATGGALSEGSRWTSPNVAGVYRVVARQSAGTLADTAVVTVTATPRITALRVTPGLAALVPGATQQFTAQPTWSDGVARSASTTWTATGGSISVNGLFTAGQLAGQALVIASCAGCAVADTAELTITQPAVAAPVVSQLVLTPSALTMGAGEAREVAVVASWSDGSTTLPPLVWTAGGGSMQGLHYVAGNTSGTYKLIVRHAGSAVSDTTTVTITGGSASAATLSTLSLTPTSVTMAPGAQRTLNLGATWTDGTTTVPPVTWTATGGTLNGLVYTAGTTPGTYRIIARHQGGTLADTTAVTIQAGAAATLQAMTVTPTTATATTGATLQLAVTGSWSDGSTAAPPVTWTATGGTITSTGLYTAGGTTGTFQVTATHAASSLTAQRSVSITAPQSWNAVNPELPRATVDVTYPQLTGRTISVAAGGNLQSAINSATCGDEIVLAAGAVFTGNFILPNKGCTSYIVIRGAAPTPPQGTRVTPATAAGYPKVMAPGANASPLEAAVGAGYYRLVGLEVSANPGAGAVNALVRLNVSTLTSLAQLPHHIVLDRMYIHGHATMDLARCVLMNSASTAVIDSYLDDCHLQGSDSQAIVSWAGSGPFLIENNYLAGAGENIMFGGSHPGLSGLIPSDITIRGNHITKPLHWSGVWTVKNLFEIKNAQRVLVEGNVLENNWVDGQTGYAVLLKATATGGNAPWTTASDITVRYNVIRNSPGALNLAADPSTNPVVPAARMRIEHNLFENIGTFNGTSGSYFGQFQGTQSGLRDIQFRHNTAVSGITASFMSFDGSTASQALVIQNNHLVLGAYGIKGSGASSGSASLNTFWRSWDFRGNALVASSSAASSYPAGNFFLTGGQGPSGQAGVGGATPGADLPQVQQRAAAAIAGIR